MKRIRIKSVRAASWFACTAWPTKAAMVRMSGYQPRWTLQKAFCDSALPIRSFRGE
jgi:hypothetical protein